MVFHFVFAESRSKRSSLKGREATTEDERWYGHARRQGERRWVLCTSRPPYITFAISCYSQACESSDFTLISDFFLLFTKPHFQTFNALKSTSFQAFQTFSSQMLSHPWGLLHKTLTGEKTLVKSENSGKHDFTIDFTIGKNSG